jgi:hypothetical protein
MVQKYEENTYFSLQCAEKLTNFNLRFASSNSSCNVWFSDINPVHFSEGQSSFIFCADPNIPVLSLSLLLLPLPDSQSRVSGNVDTFVILFRYFATFIDIALTQLLYFPCFTLSSVDLRTPHCQHYLATQIAPFRKERIKNLTMGQKQAERIKNLTMSKKQRIKSLTMSQKLTARHYYRKAHHCR